MPITEQGLAIAHLPRYIFLAHWIKIAVKAGPEKFEALC
jgi:hypothetical protein